MNVRYQEDILGVGLRKVSLFGTLDAPNSMEIEEGFQQTVSDKGGTVILDLSGVDYMSSYGLRMIMLGAKGLKTKEGHLLLASPSEYVRNILRMAGYETLFPIYDTVEEAISSSS